MQIPVFTINGAQRTLVTMLDDADNIPNQVAVFLEDIDREDLRPIVYTNFYGHDYKVFLDDKEEA